MDQRLVGVGAFQQRVVGGRHFAHAAADQQHEVGLLDRCRQLRVDADADIAGIVRVQMVEQHLAAEGAADRQRPGLGDAAHPRHRLGIPARAAEDDEGPLGLAEQFLQRVELGFAGAGFDRCVRQGGGRLDQAGQHVLGQRDDDRAGAAGGRDRKGAGDEFGDARGIVDLDHPFGDVAEEALVVDFLESLALLGVAGDLADEQDDGNRILHGDVDAGRRIGGAGAAGDEADAGLAGQAALAVGHHRGAAFLAADDGADRRIVQRVEHREIGFARHAEDAIDAVGFERVDDQLSAGLHCPDFSSSARISSVCSPRRGEGRS